MQSAFCDLLRHKYFVDDGIIIHDYDNLVFQKSFWCHGFDYESAEEHELLGVVNYLNLIFAGIPTGWVMSVNNCLVDDRGYLDTTKDKFSSSLLKVLDKEREFYFTKQAKLFRNIVGVTFTYKPQHTIMKKFGSLFESSNKIKPTVKSLGVFLEEFKNQIGQYTKLISRCMKLIEMSNDETVSYLNYLVTGRWIKFKLPKKTCIDIKYLISEDYSGGKEAKVGENHLRVIAIDNYFPDESYPLVLERLRLLGFPLRWNTRWFFLTKLEAQKNIDMLVNMHIQNMTTLKDGLDEYAGKKVIRTNRGAHYLFDEAEEALASTQISNINYGKYGCNIIVMDENEETVIERSKIIRNTLEEMGFKVRIETWNTEEAFLSTIDGDIEFNQRRSLLSTENLAEFLPISGFWHGLDAHPSPMYNNANPLFMVDCENYSKFKGNIFVNDLGHTLVVGKTGFGKSSLINFLAYSHMRYENAQIFALDNKYSMLPLCYGVNGEHFDLCADDGFSFQPLSDIDTHSGYDFACDWLETLCNINNVQINTSISKAIRSSLSALAVLPIEFRTLENLYHHASATDDQLAEVINLYCGCETIQARVVGANEDRIKFNNYNVFELGGLISKGEKALIPVLKYIFYKISKRLDGKPTLIIIEEADTLWKSSVFANQLDEWLKTLRKLNVAILLVTLQVNSIVTSSIKDTLLNQISTTIYTPNPDLKKSEVIETYKNIGLTNKQIEIIRDGRAKSQYYITNANGDRLFNLDLNYFDIGKTFFSRTSKTDIVKAINLKKIHQGNFAKAWLVDSGIEYVEV